MNYFVHEKALCETKNIGRGTRVWAFAHILPQAQIGEECNICDGVFIENDVVVGDRVTIKCGVQLWDGIKVENDVFIGPNTTFTNDMYPRSKHYPEKFARIILHKGASIGANATLLPGISIGENAMVGAGAVVTRSVPPNAKVVGNPARIIGYVDTRENTESANIKKSDEAEKVIDSIVSGVKLYKLPEIVDIRGCLSVGEFSREIPFEPLRYFIVYNVPTIETRGEHAHHECHQFLIAVKGSVDVVVDDGDKREEICLNNPNRGLYIPPMTWGIQYRYSEDAVLLVFASHYYSSEDYIRDYSDFKNIKSKKNVSHQC